MKAYVKSIQLHNAPGESDIINLELVPITGKITKEFITNLTKIMILEVSVPEDYIMTAEQLQLTMCKQEPLKQKEKKLRFRGD